MTSSAAKVADIFTAAGEAFSYLGNLTMQLHPLNSDSVSSKSSKAKWGEEEIEMLRSAVTRFGEDLKKVSEQVKTKSVAQIKTALKKGLLEQNGTQGNKKKTTSQRSSTSGEPAAKRQKTVPSSQSTKLPVSSAATSGPSSLLATAETTLVQSVDQESDAVDVLTDQNDDGVLSV